MNRRQLILGIAGLISAPIAVRAQQKPMSVIGFLSSASPGSLAPFLAAFKEGMSEAGYTEGQNVTVEYQWAEGHYDRLAELAADLVRRPVDLIVASGGLRQHARQKTRPRRSQSSLRRSAIRSQPGWSPVLPGRAETLLALASWDPS